MFYCWLVMACFAIGVVAGGLLLLPSSMRPHEWQAYPEIPRAIVFTICWLIATGVAIAVLVRARPVRLGIGMAAGTYALQLYAFVWALPDLDIYRTQKPFAEANCGASERLGTSGTLSHGGDRLLTWGVMHRSLNTTIRRSSNALWMKEKWAG